VVDSVTDRYGGTLSFIGSYTGLTGGLSVGTLPLFRYTMATPTPVAAPTPSVAPPLDNNVTSSTWGKPIPISAGNRRLPGDLGWLENNELNSEGEYTAHAGFFFGYELISNVEATLTKVWANGTIVHDDSIGFTADGWTITAYGSLQTTADPAISADKGAAITPAFKQQLYIVAQFPTIKFAGQLPNISALWTDEAGGTLFRAWGGTWDEDRKDSHVTLADEDLNATGITGTDGDSVLGTQARSAGKYVFGITVDSGLGAFGTGLGFGIGLATAAADTTLYMGSQDGFSFRWGADQGVYSGGVFGGNWTPYTTGDQVALYVNLGLRRVWGTKDGVTFYGSGSPVTADDVRDGIGGFDISGLSGALYPALTLAVPGDEATGNFVDPAFLAEIGEPGVLTLAELIVAMGVRCGYTEDDFEFVGIEDLTVLGEVIINDTPFVDWLRNKGRMHGFDYTESEGRIKIKKSVVGTTFTTDKAIVSDDVLGEVETTRAEEQDLPAAINFMYQDATIDYQLSLQRARRAEVRSSKVETFAVSEVMEADDALTAAGRALNREWEQRIFHRFTLPQTYLNLEPTDIITFSAHSKTYTAKVSAATIQSPFSIEVTAVNLLTSELIELTGTSGEPNPPSIPLDEAPVNSIAPVVTVNPTANIGAVLTVDPGTWLNMGAPAEPPGEGGGETSFTVPFTGYVPTSERYVETPANGGSDSNDGLTVGTAWATVAKCIANLTPGRQFNFGVGTFTCQDQLFTSNGTTANPIVFQGTFSGGAHQTIFSCPSSSLSALRVSGRENIVIRDIHIDGGFRNVLGTKSGSSYPRNIVLDRVYGTDANEDGFKFAQAYEVYIINSAVKGAGEEGIDFVAVIGGGIAYNKIYHIGYSGDHPSAAACFCKGGSTNIVVEHNEFVDIHPTHPTAALWGVGFTIGGSTNVTIPGVQIPGYGTPPNTYEAYNITLQFNKIHDVQGRAIEVQGGKNSTARGNFLDGANAFSSHCSLAKGSSTMSPQPFSTNIAFEDNIYTSSPANLVATPSSGHTYTQSGNVVGVEADIDFEYGPYNWTPPA
jgi:hypothetical protein